MKKKIRIGFIVNYFVSAGLENFVLSLINGLDRKKFEPFLYIMYFGDANFLRRLNDDVKIFYVNRKKGDNTAFVKVLSRRVRADKIDILQTHNWGTFLEGGILKLLNRGIKLVHVQQGQEFENTLKVSRTKRTIRKILRHFFVNIFDYVVGCSFQTKIYLRNEWGANRAILIYNSVDTKRFKQKRFKTRDLSKQNNFFICTVGRIVPVKNFLCLFKSINILKNKIPGIKLYHIGAKLLTGSQTEDELLDFINRNKLEKTIYFLGKRDDIHEILSDYDVFALTSFSEGLSFSLIEAQSVGLPAVVTAVGGNTEVIQDGVNGYLVPSNDEEAVAEALFKLYTDTEKRRLMSRNAINIVRKKFEISTMVERYEKIYCHLMNSNSFCR